MEKPKERIKRERKKLLEEKENGDVKAEGYYIFYHIFMFIAGLSLFIGVVAFIALIYFIVKICKGDSRP